MSRLALRAACALLALLLLSGCSDGGFDVSELEQVELPAPEGDGSLSAPEGDSAMAQTMEVGLYLRSSDGAMLSRMPAQLEITYAEDDAQAVMQLLLSAAGEEGRSNPIPQGTRLLGVEHTDGVATVDLSIDALDVASPQDLLWMDAAIAATLCELPDVSCVNLLIGGRKYAIWGMSTGVLTARSADAPLLWSRFRTDQEYIGAGDGSYEAERTALIYYPARSGGMFLPTPCIVRFSEGGDAARLVDMLCLLPEGAEGVQPAAEALRECEIRTVVTEDGRRLMELRFSEDAWGRLEAGCGRDASCAAAALTLLSFVPEVDGVAFYCGDQPLDSLELGGEALRSEGGTFTRDALRGHVGCAVELCFGGASGDGLTRVDRVLSPMVERYPRVLLSLLIQGPLEGEDAESALPRGVTEDDILGIALSDGVMSVNMSANFYRLCQPLGADAERRLVYSVVNTLCSLAGVEEVQFFVAGERADVLSEAIYIRTPLMPNPGMME